MSLYINGEPIEELQLIWMTPIASCMFSLKKVPCNCRVVCDLYNVQAAIRVEIRSQFTSSLIPYSVTAIVVIAAAIVTVIFVERKHSQGDFNAT